MDLPPETNRHLYDFRRTGGSSSSRPRPPYATDVRLFFRGRQTRHHLFNLQGGGRIPIVVRSPRPILLGRSENVRRGAWPDSTHWPLPIATADSRSGTISSPRSNSRSRFAFRRRMNGVFHVARYTNGAWLQPTGGSVPPAKGYSRR